VITKKYKDLLSVFRAWKLVIPKTMPEMADAIPADCFLANKAPGLHPWSEAYRQLAVRAFLLSAVQENQKEFSIRDLYGSQRAAGLRYVQSLATKAGFVLNHHIDRDRSYGNDEAANRPVRPGVATADVTLIQDVYHITPERLWELTDPNVSRHGVFLIVRKFQGEMGCEPRASGTEAVWYRKDDQIVFRASHTEDCYEPHPDMAYVHQSRIKVEEGDMVTSSEPIGPYHLIRVVRAARVGPFISQPEGGQFVKVPFTAATWQQYSLALYPRLYQRLYGFLMSEPEGDKMLIVNQRVYAQHGGISINKNATKFNISSWTDLVGRAYDDDPVVRALRNTQDPELLQMILDGRNDTIAMCLYHQRMRNSVKTGILADAVLDAENILNTYKSNLATGLLANPASTTATILAGGMVLYGVRKEGIMRMYSHAIDSFGSGLMCLGHIEREHGFTPSDQGVAALALYAGIRAVSRGDLGALWAIFGAPIAEEYAKRTCWGFLPFTIGLETLLYSRMTGVRIQYMLLQKILVHGGLQMLPFWEAVRAHMLWNTSVYLAQGQSTGCLTMSSLWHCFKQTYDEYGTIDKVGSCALPRGATLAAKHSCVRQPVDEQQFDVKVEVSGQLVSDLSGFDPEQTNQKIHPILITNACPHRPAGGLYNTYAAIVLRVVRDPYQGRKPQNAGWAGLAAWCFENGLLMRVVLSEDADSWIVTITDGMKKRRARRFKDILDDGGTVMARKLKMSVHVKIDETLYPKTLVYQGNEFKTLSPRAICNCDPRSQVLAQPWFMAVTKFLKEWWHEDQPHTIDGVTVTCVYGSGLTGQRFNDLLSVFEERSGWVFIQAGDDSLIRDPTGRWFEGDFSKYDHTQGLEACECELACHALMGCPDHVLDIIRYGYVAPYSSVARGREWVLRGKRIGRATGGGNTTLDNTRAGLTSLAYVCLTWGVDQLVDKMYTEFGMVLKLEQVTKYTATFLKGWWCTSSDGDVWLPLPSLLLKLGKVMRHPILIAAGTGRNKTRDADRCLRRVAYAMASSPGQVPAEYPLLGPFIATLRRLGESYNGEAPSESWRPKALAHNVDRAACLEKMCHRYDLSVGDIIEMEEQMRQISSLPALLSHPGYLALARVDYGA